MRAIYLIIPAVANGSSPADETAQTPQAERESRIRASLRSSSTALGRVRLSRKPRFTVRQVGR